MARVTVTPYLCTRNAARAIDFYTTAFGATEVYRIPGAEDGKIGHAELRIGDATIMLSDEYPELGVVSPQALSGTTVTMSLIVPDVDAFVQRAVDAGAVLKRPAQDQSYGLRTATILDPFGHRWIIGTPLQTELE